MEIVVSDPILPGHPRWEEFLDRLCGPDCMDVVVDESWNCFGDLRFSERVLGEMGVSGPALAVNIQYFKNHGGYCDCEVVLNVDAAGQPFRGLDEAD